jgi:flavin-dependent dehydrogenase
VIVVDKERFPRYRIGESMIPYCWFALERLGLLDAMDSGNFSVPKHSVQFVAPDGTQTTPFYFNTHIDHPCARTWQVRRTDFDRVLLDHARTSGAQIMQGMTVRDLCCHGGAIVGVDATDEEGTEYAFRAPITIDASGRGLLAVNRLRWRVADPHLQKMSIWTYYKGAKRDPGLDEGATTVAYIEDKGWFWYIPLPDDTVSVGVVAEKSALFSNGDSLESIFDRKVAGQAWIADHIRSGRCIAEHKATGDYSYRSRYCAANGLVLAGDAFAFLDPVFSSGLFLALDGGVRVADAVHIALRDGDTGAAQFAAYGQAVCHGIEAMRRLVYAFYDPGFSFGSFLRAHPEFRRDVTDLLIGHVLKDYDPMFAAIGAYAAIPAPLSHGSPMIEPLTLPDSKPNRN